jgi:hypothetical protein
MAGVLEGRGEVGKGLRGVVGWSGGTGVGQKASRVEDKAAQDIM